MMGRETRRRARPDAARAPGSGRPRSRSTTAIAVVVAFALGVAAGPVAADPGDDDAARRGAPRVVAVHGNLEVDDLLRVEVEGLATWAATHDVRTLVPYLNGRALRGIYPEDVDLAHGLLGYHLAITRTNREVWIDLLGAPTSLRTAVTFTVGPEEGPPFDTVHDRRDRLALTVISPAYGVVALLLVLLLVGALVGLGRRTGLLREPGATMPGQRAPYSLGRVQMAFWFVLVCGAYVVIWLVTGAVDTVTAPLLGLMGISGATALSEVMIDGERDAARERRLIELSAEQEALAPAADEAAQEGDATARADAATPARDASVRPPHERRARLLQIARELERLRGEATVRRSRGLLRDLLADTTGYNLQRFQMLAWTIVLGVVFVSAVYNQLTLPELDGTLLALMGISSGTYIGFKLPERRGDDPRR